MKNRNILYSIIVIILIIACGFLFYRFEVKKFPHTNGQGTSTLTYVSKQYGFKVDYPSDWSVTENTDLPAISIHKKTDPVGTSYGIHASSTSVTIYPQGLGTEGPQGQSKQSEINFLGATTTLTDMFLKDGYLWAELIPVKNGPTAKGWNQYALIWAGLEVKDLKVTCITKDGSEKPADACDMGVEFIGSQFVRSGTSNQADGPILEKIVRSITFTP